MNVKIDELTTVPVDYEGDWQCVCGQRHHTTINMDGWMVECEGCGRLYLLQGDD